MPRKRILAALALAVLAACALVVVVVSRVSGDRHTGGTWAAGADGIDVRASLAPRHVLFGDTVHARVDVTVDPARIDPEAVHIATDFSPWKVVGVPERTRRDVGDAAQVKADYVLRCLARDCIPTGRSVSYELQPARVVYETRDDSTTEKARIRARWPSLTVQSRITGVGMDDRGERFTPWRADLLELPDPSYRLAPSLLLAALVSGAVLAALAAAVLVFLAWPRKPRIVVPEPEPEVAPARVLTPLEHALLLLEDTTRSDGAEDRRRALELVAEELEQADWGNRELARSAKALAWSPESPPLDRTSDLAARVRSVLPADEDEDEDEANEVDGGRSDADA